MDFVGVFSKLGQYGYDSRAALGRECSLKSPDQGAAEGAPSITDQFIEATEAAFDDFAGEDPNIEAIRNLMG